MVMKEQEMPVNYLRYIFLAVLILAIIFSAFALYTPEGNAVVATDKVYNNSTTTDYSSINADHYISTDLMGNLRHNVYDNYVAIQPSQLQ